MKPEQSSAIETVSSDLLAAGFTHLERERASGLSGSSVRPDIVAWGANTEGELSPQVSVEVLSTELGPRERAGALSRLSAAAATLGTPFNMVHAGGQWYEADAGFIELRPVDAPPRAQSRNATVTDPEVLQQFIAKEMWAAAQTMRGRESLDSWNLVASLLDGLRRERNGRVHGLASGTTAQGSTLAEEILVVLGKNGRGIEEHLTPNTVSVAMANVAQARGGETILDPFAGAGGVLLATAATLPDITVPVQGYEINAEVRELCGRLLELAGVPFELRSTDSLADAWEPADVVVTNPPMGIRTRETLTFPFGRTNNGEVAAIARGVQALRNGGRAVLTTTRSWTFRSGDAAALREWLSENYRVTALIGLPSVLPGTQVAPLITVVDAAAPSATVVADLSTDWQEQLAPDSELIAQIPRST